MRPLIYILFLLAACTTAAQSVSPPPGVVPQTEIDLLTEYYALDSLEVYCVAEGMDFDSNKTFYVINSSVPFAYGQQPLMINADVDILPSEYDQYDAFNILISDKTVMKRIAKCYVGQFSENPKCGADEFMEHLYIQLELALIKHKIIRTAAQNELVQSAAAGKTAGADIYLADVAMQLNIDSMQMLISDVNSRMERLKRLLGE